MTRQSVILEIVPGRMLLAVLRPGQPTLHRAGRIDTADLQKEWPGALPTLAPRLREWAGQLGVSGADVTIVYHAPTATVIAHSCPEASGASGAQHAAELALRGERAGGALRIDTQPLHTDRHAGGSDSVAQRHTLGVADTAQSVRALADLAEAAGLAAATILPIGAAKHLAALQAVKGGNGERIRAWMWLGEHQSVLCAGGDGRLALMRSIEIGTEALVDALCRPIRPARAKPRKGTRDRQNDGAEQEMVTLDRAKARRILFTAGIPRPEDTLDAELGIEGASVLPLLQPVLQRLAVEIKQSIRFALSEQDRAGVDLRVTGASVLVPGLADALSRLSGTALATDETPLSGEPIGDLAAGDGTVGAWKALADCTLNLVPEEIDQGVTRASVRTSIRAGFCVAATLIAANAAFSWFSLSRERSRLGELQGTTRDVAAQTLHASARFARQQRDALRARLISEIGATVPAAELLASMSAATPDGVRFTSVSIECSDLRGKPAGGAAGAEDAAVCVIEGLILTSDAQQLAAILKQLNGQLAALPMVRKVRMGATQRTDLRGEPAQHFDLKLSLVGLPHALALGGDAADQASVEVRAVTPGGAP